MCCIKVDMIQVSAMKRQNVLFVVFDQLRADCLHGALGSDVALPNLREFMTDAVSFTNHVSVTAPCGPARASLLTGQYAMNHRSVRNGTPLPADKPNLATELRRGGVQPLLYGYTDTSADPRHHAADDPILTSYEQVMPGFLEALEMRFDDSRIWRGYLAACGYDVPEGSDLYMPAGDSPRGAALYKAEHSDTAFLTDRVLADLPTRADGWCAHVTYIRPHPPFVAPAPYNRSVDPASVPPADGRLDIEAFRKAHPFNAPAMDYCAPRDMVCGFPQIEDSPETTGVLRALYLGLIAELDHHFGRIITHLKQAGQYDNTLIIITSDHGELLSTIIAGASRTISMRLSACPCNPPAGRWQGGQSKIADRKYRCDADDTGSSKYRCARLGGRQVSGAVPDRRHSRWLARLRCAELDFERSNRASGNANGPPSNQCNRRSCVMRHIRWCSLPVICLQFCLITRQMARRGMRLMMLTRHLRGWRSPKSS